MKCAKELTMYIKTSDQEKMQLGIGDYSCNWGAHICGLYESEEERDEIILGFLSKGDLSGDLQLYCPDEQTPEMFKEKYYHACPECQGHVDDPNVFQILNSKDLYYPNGTFSPREMDTGLNNFYAESQKNGKRNIRATAEMSWALKAIPGIEHLMAYESRLNYFIPGKPWISICLYNVNRFSASIVMNVLRTHPFTISGGIIIQNPYYQHPDKWLAENAPQFLNPQ